MDYEDYPTSYYEEHEEYKFVTEKIYNKETGLLRREFTRLNGMMQSPPDDSPAVIQYDKEGYVKSRQWCHEASEHREDGPSKIVYYDKTDTPLCHYFKKHGEYRYACEGPSTIWFNRDGSVKRFEYEEELGPGLSSMTME